MTNLSIDAPWSNALDCPATGAACGRADLPCDRSRDHDGMLHQRRCAGGSWVWTTNGAVHDWIGEAPDAG